MNFKVFSDCIHFPLDRPCTFQKNDATTCVKCNRYQKISKKNSYTNILIVKLGAMGDVLRTTFLLEGLKVLYPDSKITWIVAVKNYAVLENNHLIDTIIKNDEKTLEFLARNYFDIVINLDLAPESLALAKISNKRKVIGYTIDDKRKIIASNKYAKQWLKMSAYDILKKANALTYQHCMAKIVGLKDDKYEIICPLTQSAKEKALKFLQDNSITKDKKIIGINPGAGKRWPLKKWTTQGFIDVAKYFSSKGYTILLLGGKDDKEEIEAILSKNIKNVFSTGIDNSVSDFFAMINLCDVILCGDTMALHAASGLKKNVIALFGPTSIAEIELYQRGTKIYSNKDCLCCYKQNCNISNNCMKEIPSQKVIREIEKYL